MKISKKIINLRNENKLTQEELAELLCVSRQTVSNWENEKCYPDIDTLIIISEKFNASLDELLKDDQDMLNDISKKMKVNKLIKTIIMVLTVSLIFLIWFGYKNYLLCYYDNNYNDDIFNNYEKYLEEISINTYKTSANKKYKDMNIYIPEDLIFETEGKYTQHIREKAIYMSTQKTLFPTILENQIFLKAINYQDVFNKYKIVNQNDLIKYFKENNNKEKNILWNKSQMELKFLAEYFVANEINNGGYNYRHYYWNNETQGYISEFNNKFLVYIYNKDNTYLIDINKNFYKLNDVIKIIESIYFE